MAWRLAVVTEDGTEKLEMAPEALKEFILLCAQAGTNGNAEINEKVKQAIEAGFKKADAYLRQETVRIK